MDEKLIEEFISDKQALIEDVNTGVDLVYEALKQLWKLMAFENNGTTSRMEEFFRFCTEAISPVESSVTVLPFQTVSSTDPQLEGNATTYQLPSNTSGSISVELFPEEDLYSWLNVTSQDQCDDAYRKFKKLIDDVIVIPCAHIHQNQEFFSFAAYFVETAENLYRKCFHPMNKSASIIYLFVSVCDLADTMVHSGLPEGLAIFKQFLAHYKKFQILKYSKEFHTELEETCEWRKDLLRYVT